MAAFCLPRFQSSSQKEILLLKSQASRVFIEAFSRERFSQTADPGQTAPLPHFMFLFFGGKVVMLKMIAM